ncbi:MAG: hypothetical protein L0Z62_15750, partial [Gemmataceae bacterium]|nr:hypothetical protein [Gemmataceae bacterium]
DAWAEEEESVTVTLTAGTGYTVGGADHAEVIIADGSPDTGPQVSITATQPYAFEADQQPGQFTVSRSGDTTSSLTVYYTISGTATPGSDYTTLYGSVVLAPGESSMTVDVIPVDDTTAEPDETVELTLTSNPNYGLSQESSATVTIVDNDSVVTVTASDPNAAEAGPDAGVFTVSRTGDTTGELTVAYTISGTATAELDYEALSGLATIAAGAASTTITVSPVNDTLQEGSETVEVTLEPSIGYTVGTPSSATVTIADDATDTGPQVTITATDSSANEDTLDPAVFTVTRTGSLSEGLTVFYEVSGLAVSGEDYVALNGSVYIQPSASSATIVVIPYDDSLSEGQETVVATLTPAAAYQVGQPSSAVAFIDEGSGDQQPSITFLDATKTKVPPFLRVAKWKGAFVGNAPLQGDLFQNDPDRFHIRVKDPSKAAQGSITIQISTIGSADSRYNDNPTTITLTKKAGTQDVFETPNDRSQVLVSNVADERHKVNNVADDVAEDRTHIVALDGSVRVTYPGSTAAPVTKKVPVLKRVQVNVNILTDALHAPLIGEPFVDSGTPTGVPVYNTGERYWDVNGNKKRDGKLNLPFSLRRVERDIRIANESYAQVGVHFQAFIQFATAPKELLKQGEEGFVALNPTTPVSGDKNLKKPGAYERAISLRHRHS